MADEKVLLEVKLPGDGQDGAASANPLAQHVDANDVSSTEIVEAIREQGTHHRQLLEDLIDAQLERNEQSRVEPSDPRDKRSADQKIDALAEAIRETRERAARARAGLEDAAQSSGIRAALTQILSSGALVRAGVAFGVAASPIIGSIVAVKMANAVKEMADVLQRAGEPFIEQASDVNGPVAAALGRA